MRGEPLCREPLSTTKADGQGIASSGIGCFAGSFSLFTAAEMIARDYGLTRQDLYAFALDSYRRRSFSGAQTPSCVDSLERPDAKREHCPQMVAHFRRNTERNVAHSIKETRPQQGRAAPAMAGLGQCQ